MACYHPLQALRIGTKDNGKAELVFLRNYIDDRQFMIEYNGHIYPRSALVALPCGQCIGCRIDYSRQWANRCLLENEYHDSSFFVTLTYDDEHVPRTYYANPETEEAIPALTLQKRDFQLFMKRLRKHFCNDKIRFYACGEYGSETFRPHYHAIIYGLHLSDLTVYKTVREGGQFYTYYNSAELQSIWPCGYVVVGAVTWESCAYTARYILKKQKGKDAEFYELHNIEPEFVLMSRRPGIARQYYDDNKERIYDTDEINVSSETGGKHFRPPRYFDKLFDIDCPAEFAAVKKQRETAGVAAQKAKLSRTSLDSIELREVEEAAFGNKIKSLRRNL